MCSTKSFIFPHPGFNDADEEASGFLDALTVVHPNGLCYVVTSTATTQTHYE